MLTSEEIKNARKKLKITYHSPENDENIRIAYEWLDAQQSTEMHLGRSFDLKSLISDWGGRNISQEDIAVSVLLHSRIKGDYPLYNINHRLTFPSAERLRKNITSLAAQRREKHLLHNYRYYEVVDYSSIDGRSVQQQFSTKTLPMPKDETLDYCETHDCQCYYCVYGR